MNITDRLLQLPLSEFTRKTIIIIILILVSFIFICIISKTILTASSDIIATGSSPLLHPYGNNIVEGLAGETPSPSDAPKIDNCTTNNILNKPSQNAIVINEFTKDIYKKLYYLKYLVSELDSKNILPIEFRIKTNNTKEIDYNKPINIIIDGELPIVDLTLKLPKSEPGAQGVQGIVGKPGKNGDIGPAGIIGEMGYWSNK